MLNMLNRLFILLNTCNMFLSVDSFYIKCSDYKDIDSCLTHDLCKWCNVTNSYNRDNSTIYNSTGVCKYATSYVEDNDICVYGEHYLFVVKMINIIINLTMIIIFFVLLTYIVGISELILNKYFESSTNQDNDRIKEKGILVTIITFSLFMPAIMFLIFRFNLFLLYFLFILILTIIISCSINTRKLYNYNKHNKYEGGSYETIK